jgi:hypothetical protein
MAKPKFPKKSNDVKDAPSIPSTPPVVTADSGAATTEVAARPVTETKKAEPKKSEPKKTVRKPEIVRTDSRATLVPINLEEEIRRLAYLYSERRGFTPGHETEDWLAAEHEVRLRYHQQSAAASA